MLILVALHPLHNIPNYVDNEIDHLNEEEKGTKKRRHQIFMCAEAGRA